MRADREDQGGKQLRALRKSLLVIVTAWAMCGMTAPPAYAAAQVVNAANVVVAV
jgi:hypothetical protein